MHSQIHHHLTFNTRADFNAFKNQFVAHRILNLNKIKPLPASLKPFKCKDPNMFDADLYGIIQHMHTLGFTTRQLLKILRTYIAGAEYALAFKQYMGGGDITTPDGIKKHARKMHRHAMRNDPFYPNATPNFLINYQHAQTKAQYQNMRSHNCIFKEGWMYTHWHTISNTSHLSVDPANNTLSFYVPEDTIVPALTEMHKRSGNIPFKLIAYDDDVAHIPKYHDVVHFKGGAAL